MYFLWITCTVLGTTLALAILAREAVCWWLNRHVRRNQKLLKAIADEHYAVMAREAVREAEAFLRELRRS